MSRPPPNHVRGANAILKGALAQAEYQSRMGFAIEQRYLVIIKALVARLRNQETAVTDAEIAAAHDMRLGLMPHGEQGSILRVRSVGEGFNPDDDLGGMDARMVERGA